MKSIKALLVVTALSISSLAMAEGGADRTFARMEQARQTSLEAYRVAQQQKVEGSCSQQSNRASRAHQLLKSSTLQKCNHPDGWDMAISYCSSSVRLVQCTDVES